MRLLAGLLGRKSRDTASGMASDLTGGQAAQHRPDVEHPMPPDVMPSVFADSKTKAVFDAQRQVDAAAKPPVNIWDLEDEAANRAMTSAVSAVQAAQTLVEAQSRAVEPAARASAQSRRNRTRIIGFERSGGEIVDLFDAQKTTTPAVKAVFPVGWLLVVEGPGRGHCFSLFAGMAQIGRGEDQSVQLDFGDGAISRNNHAAVVFDPEERKFVLGHGGKANIVRLNGKPVVTSETLSDGDRIRIGETTLQLKVLCGPDFHWGSDAKAVGEDDDDMAIA